MGEGTGLGLSTVYGIVKQHDGNIWVSSEPGKGTSFTIYLPSAESHQDLLITRDNAFAEAIGGTETILLVEDESVVRKIAQRYLNELGYTALCAENSDAALEIAAHYEGHIDLLLSDVIMPGGDGLSLYRKLTSKIKGLKVIFMSGYADKALAHSGVFESGAVILEKPFHKINLSQKIRDVINQSDHP